MRMRLVHFKMESAMPAANSIVVMDWLGWRRRRVAPGHRSRVARRRAAAPPAPPLPLLAFPDGTFYSLPYGPCRFPGFGCAGYRGAACGSWLVFPRDDGCFLVDPFSGATVTLPALSPIRLRPANAAVKYAEREEQTVRIGFTWMDMKFSEKMEIINKLVVCSPNLVAAFFGSASMQGGGHTSQILVCQPRASSWSVRALDQCKEFEDMAFYQGKLYALAVDENLLTVNISQDPRTGDPQVARIGQVIKGDPDPFLEAWWPDDTTGRKKLYLIESCGTLLMVRRKVCCRISEDAPIVAEQNKFEVFKADIKHSRWMDVTTLGDDQMLFLGRQCSRAVSASQYGMSGDQIFFMDDEMENAAQYTFDSEENTSVGVYDMRTGEVSSPLPMVWKHGVLLVTWLFP
ncbi:hypothetical protein BAE44_0014071 [Dichanthelium oligosanthes]|uniref:KIB1-4 beta-propeller domain-containing protein n=1 Tax=Dichanthelium oligosanthes TaxID=888268 RepID=A0A1E5VIH1_9POAL|nr:hypothetical protein BAE44_0014071 [Dichanthelium oligosanthes]